MAYNRKYKITMATKSGGISTLYLWEDGYEGDLIEYPAESISLQYIPMSDDVFEPIYVSQLGVVIDVTDNLAQMPDFTELDDRKYYVELLNDDEEIDFLGWTISDIVQFSFTTGRKTLAFNAIDGLGLLGKIAFSYPQEETLITRNTTLFHINSALSKIAFPVNLRILSGISFYADGMLNRYDNLYNEPLIQSYLQNLSFVGNTYLEVLTAIISGFGCRLFQAKGIWYIVPLTQIAADSYYFTLYENDTVVDSGLKSDLGNIEGFTGNTSNLFFTDNSQFKLLRKGYNKIISKNDAAFAENYVSNGNFKSYIGNVATFWTNSSLYGSVTLKQNPNSDYNAMVLNLQKVTSAAGYASIKTTYLTGLNIGDSGNLSFNCVLKSFSITPPNLVKIKIIVDGTAEGYGIWYLTADKKWSNFGTNYYFEPYKDGNTVYDVKIDLPATSFAGNMSIEILLENTTSTIINQVVEVQNVVLTQQSAFQGVTTTSTINSNNDYIYEAKIGIGFNSSNANFNYYKGYLSDASGNALNTWYSLNYPSNQYSSLSELVVKQYANVLSKNIINIDSTFMSMRTQTGRFSGAMRITADDTDPAQISVQDRKYIVGNTTMDLFNDTIQTTLLEITDLDNPNAIISTNYNSPNIVPNTEYFVRYIGEGFETGGEAASSSVGSTAVFAATNNTNPPVGYLFYGNDLLTFPFDGAFLWYKFDMDTETHVYKISSEGQILEIYS
ncbi:hypothetical protein UFOVP213_15 [uncultured Caudovirales phage]|uniref:Uncharacterized protein n=1 Tax=uncultured Caudovirales phage TaxID=2100421 RepID=A0A6J7WP39_9CAUD|nr:hypothetical protein UFOVP213_15 [uncultured Caudovirales phage]